MIIRDEVKWRGVSRVKPAVQVNGQTFIIHGRYLKTARLKQEWEHDVTDSDAVIQALKDSSGRVDLLRFWQRVPESEIKHPYYNERREIAVIPVSTFDHWWQKQINGKTRNMVRKSQKIGVIIGEVAIDDDFVRQVMGIYNETPVRRGKPFWHYGKEFETVKSDLLIDAEKSLFIAAHHEGELIGFIKLLLTDRYAMTTLILDKISRRDKAPMNGMIAKAVEVCANRRISFLTYTVWRRGDQAEFQRRNGFEPFSVPEYFVPLTMRGRLVLKMGLHKGVKGALPEKWTVWLLNLRYRWYSTRFGQKMLTRTKTRESAVAPA